jgi:DNA-directed RNA polymerase specialized sigma24 family protein
MSGKHGPLRRSLAKCPNKSNLSRRERARAGVSLNEESRVVCHREIGIEQPGRAVEPFLEGDAAAFQELVDATSARFVRLNARMLGNVGDAEDVVQEAYVKAYRSLLDEQFDRRAKVESDVRGAPDGPAMWLYRIVVNATIDARRKRTRRGPEIAEILGCSEGAVEQRLVRAPATLSQWREDS